MKSTKREQYAKLQTMPNGWLIEQIKVYGEYMPRLRAMLCILVLRQRGAIDRQCAAQSVDIYCKVTRSCAF